MSVNSLIGKQLGPYRILRLIGQGGFAWVFLAVHEGLGRQVALKVLLPAHAQNHEFVVRFLREARISAELEHSNIVHIYDVGDQDGYHYIAMAYVDGESLQALLRKRERLSLQEALGIARQVGAALDHAHARGVVHRDVKPSNILIDKSGKAYLTDFGIARATWEARVTKTGVRIGTPEYMSPEQAQGQEPDKRSDLYSLGVVLYEMLCGRPPFEGRDPLSVLHKIVYEPVPSPRRANPGIPAAVEEAILRALEKRPGARFQSGAEIVRALRGAASGSVKATEGTHRKTQRLLGSPSTLGAVVAGVLALVALVVVVGYVAGKGKHSGETLMTATVAPKTVETTREREETAQQSELTASALATERVAATASAKDTATALSAERGTATASARKTATAIAAERAAATAYVATAVALETQVAKTAEARCLVPVEPSLVTPGQRSRLGCPTQAANVVWVAWQPFEHGYMLWRSDTQLVTVVYSGGSQRTFPDQWSGEDYSADSPPSGKVAPIRGFGWIWVNHAEVQEGLGWGIERERGVCVLVQEFERGFAFRVQGGRCVDLKAQEERESDLDGATLPFRVAEIATSGAVQFYW